MSEFPFSSASWRFLSRAPRTVQVEVPSDDRTSDQHGQGCPWGPTSKVLYQMTRFYTTHHSTREREGFITRCAICLKCHEISWRTKYPKLKKVSTYAFLSTTIIVINDPVEMVSNLFSNCIAFRIIIEFDVLKFKTFQSTNWDLQLHRKF